MTLIKNKILEKEWSSLSHVAKEVAIKEIDSDNFPYVVTLRDYPFGYRAIETEPFKTYDEALKSFEMKVAKLKKLHYE